MWQFLECCFAFALVWSIGASTDLDGRVQFDKFVRELMNGQKPDAWDLGPLYRDMGPMETKMATPFPEKGLCFDYMFDKKTFAWQQPTAMLDRPTITQ